MVGLGVSVRDCDVVKSALFYVEYKFVGIDYPIDGGILIFSKLSLFKIATLSIVSQIITVDV